MGDKIKILNTISINDNVFEIELNAPTKNQIYDIHIQNNFLKLCYKDQDFCQFVVCVLLARERFKKFKTLNNHIPVNC